MGQEEEKQLRTKTTSESRAKSSIENKKTSFGDRSAQLSKEEIIPDEEFHSDTSDIEKSLLASIPGVSKHLDDSHDHIGSDVFYYTEWDDPIYVQFQDYDYESDSNFEAVKEKETERPVSKKGEILLDLSRYPKKLPRKSVGGPQHGDQ